MKAILKIELMKIIEDFAIGCSVNHPCGWINTDDLRKIADMIDNSEYDQFGNEACQYNK